MDFYYTGYLCPMFTPKETSISVIRGISHSWLKKCHKPLKSAFSRKIYNEVPNNDCHSKTETGPCIGKQDFGGSDSVYHKKVCLM